MQAVQGPNRPGLLTVCALACGAIVLFCFSIVIPGQVVYLATTQSHVEDSQDLQSTDHVSPQSTLLLSNAASNAQIEGQVDLASQREDHGHSLAKRLANDSAHLVATKALVPAFPATTSPKALSSSNEIHVSQGNDLLQIVAHSPRMYPVNSVNVTQPKRSPFLDIDMRLTPKAWQKTFETENPKQVAIKSEGQVKSWTGDLMAAGVLPHDAKGNVASLACCIPSTKGCFNCLKKI
jgi:hypothetical protein